jgi:aryl-alcohol dehydrogenase-like predicted oxidoreductase
VEETLEALATLHSAGRIAEWGVSNFAAWQVLELRARAAAFGLCPPVASQLLYNPLVRQLDVEYFRFAAAYPIHTTVYNVLAAGLLARPGPPPPKSRLATNTMYRRRYGSDALRGAAERFAAVAAEAGLRPLELAYAFVAGRPGVDSLLVGPATRAHLDEALAAGARSLDEAQVAAVERVYMDLVGTDARYAR